MAHVLLHPPPPSPTLHLALSPRSHRSVHLYRPLLLYKSFSKTPKYPHQDQDLKSQFLFIYFIPLLLLLRSQEKSRMVVISKIRNPQVQIRSVWAHNLDVEFELIRHSVDRFPFAAMDTEFPGVIIRPPEYPFRRTPLAEIYSALKSNVDFLSLIQLGLTLSNSAGDLPTFGSDPTGYIWEFNFSDFDIDRDTYNHDSIALLKSNGMDFDKIRTNGINSFDFAYYLMSSGVILNESMTWVTFHSAYDFAYLVKVLSGRVLPEGLGEFMELVGVYFGKKGFYDIKYMMRFCDGLYGGLDGVAGLLGLRRVVGRSHHAGSDSLLTWQVFLKMREMWFAKEDNVESKYAGVLFGLEVN